MSAEVVAIERKPVMLDDERLDLLTRTLAPGLTAPELQLFGEVCNRTGLDPFMKQIYAVKRANRMTIQVAIDGYRLIADRTGKYAGNDDPTFEGSTADGYPLLARTTVYKIVAGQRAPFTASARWSEYYPGPGGAGEMWRKMPHVMLGKVAEALALRKAFPAELSGLYTSEEMDQGETIDVPPVPTITERQAVDLGRRLEAVGKTLGAYPDAWIQAGLPPLKAIATMPMDRVPEAEAILDAAEAEIAKAGEEPEPTLGDDEGELPSVADIVTSPAGEPHGYDGWTREQLVEECTERELPHSGTKERMVRELRAWDVTYQPEYVEPAERPF